MFWASWSCQYRQYIYMRPSHRNRCLGPRHVADVVHNIHFTYSSRGTRCCHRISESSTLWAKFHQEYNRLSYLLSVLHPYRPCWTVPKGNTGTYDGTPMLSCILDFNASGVLFLLSCQQETDTDHGNKEHPTRC